MPGVGVARDWRWVSVTGGLALRLSRLHDSCGMADGVFGIFFGADFAREDQHVNVRLCLFVQRSTCYVLQRVPLTDTCYSKIAQSNFRNTLPTSRGAA